MAPPAITTFSPWGGQNVIIPGFDKTYNLVVNFARNEKDFAINKYVTRRNAKLIRGYYPFIYAPDLVRMQYPGLGNDMVWPLGQPRPMHYGNDQRFTNVNYEMRRYTWNGYVDDITASQEQWDIKKMVVNRNSIKLLTFQTAYTIAKMVDATQYPTANTSTATAAATAAGLTGGFWSAGTVTNPVIMGSLNYARTQILKQTIGRVREGDLKLVLGPELATAMSTTQEIHTYMKEQAGSLDVLRGERPDAGESWMLPQPLYGVEVVVEASAIVTTPQNVGVDDVPTFIMDKNNAVVVARPGSVNADLGGADFSTVHIAELDGYNFQTIEEYRKLDGGTFLATDIFFETFIAAPQSGYLFTNTLS